MLLLDVNVLIYAFRNDSARHDEYEAWLTGAAQSGEPIGIPELGLVGFIRIVTNPRVYRFPSSAEEGFSFLEALHRYENVFMALPGGEHRQIFRSLCPNVSGGNDVTDAYLAALAIETGGEFVTADRGFGRFPGLRWRHPFDN